MQHEVTRPVNLNRDYTGGGGCRGWLEAGGRSLHVSVGDSGVGEELTSSVLESRHRLASLHGEHQDVISRHLAPGDIACPLTLSLKRKHIIIS